MRRMNLATMVGLTGLWLALSAGCQTPPANPPTPDGGHSGVDGGDDGGVDGGSDGGSTYSSLAQFDSDVAQALCEMEMRCGRYASQPTCTTAVSRLVDPAEYEAPTLRDIERAVEDGRARFDGDAAAQCVARVRTLDCAETQSLRSGPCAQAVVGEVAVEEPCFGNFECGPTGYCDASAQTCPGTCQARVGAGEPAFSGVQCPPGTYFDVDGTCKPYVALGQPCSAGFGIGDRPLCVPEGSCDITTDICRPRKALGGTCESNAECVPMFVCREGTCQQAAGAGASCQRNDGTCQLDLQCLQPDFTEPGSCSPFRAEGEPCDAQTRCQSGLMCEGEVEGTPPTPGTCRPLHAEGQPCNPDALTVECGPSTWCSRETQTCQARKALGEACTEPDSCEWGEAFCDGTCKPLWCEDATP